MRGQCHPGKDPCLCGDLTKNDLLLVISGTGRNPALEEVARLARENGAASSLSQATGTRRWPSRRIMSCWLPTGSSASLRGDHAPSQLSVLLVIEVLYYLMLLGE